MRFDFCKKTMRSESIAFLKFSKYLQFKNARPFSPMASHAKNFCSILASAPPDFWNPCLHKQMMTTSESYLPVTFGARSICSALRITCRIASSRVLRIFACNKSMHDSLHGTSSSDSLVNSSACNSTETTAIVSSVNETHMFPTYLFTCRLK